MHQSATLYQNLQIIPSAFKNLCLSIRDEPSPKNFVFKAKDPRKKKKPLSITIRADLRKTSSHVQAQAKVHGRRRHISAPDCCWSGTAQLGKDSIRYAGKNSTTVQRQILELSLSSCLQSSLDTRGRRSLVAEVFRAWSKVGDNEQVVWRSHRKRAQESMEILCF
jgi:hypothetical protein